MTTHSAKRIVIIGGGPAGYEAALVGARYGADITLIEDNGLGGSEVIDDCVPSKSFIAGANVKNQHNPSILLASLLGFSQLALNKPLIVLYRKYDMTIHHG